MTKISDTRNSSMLKQDYSILQQMMLMANDAGAIGRKQQMSVITKWGCWNRNVKTINGAKHQGNSICRAQTISFILTNGSYICMDDFGDTRFGVKPQVTTIGILVDVNGDNQPNTIGKDIFAFVFKGDKLVPGGYDMTPEEVDRNCSLGLMPAHITQSRQQSKTLNSPL